MIDHELIPPPGESPKLVTTRVLAKWPYVTPNTVRAWVRDGILPRPVNLRKRKTLFNVEEVRERLRAVVEGRWTIGTGGRNGKS